MKKLLILFILAAVASAVVYTHLGTIGKIGTINITEIVGNQFYKTSNQRSSPFELNYSVPRAVPGSISPLRSTNLRNAVCRLIWRYSFVCALEYALNESNVDKVRSLAEKLRGKTVQDSVWNVLAWEEKNLKYNWSKATLNPTVIEYVWNNGVESVKIVRRGIWYQTPAETLEKRNGICGDYAILTSALLADMNVTPYPIVVNFTSGTGHAAVLVRIGGWYFVLDQHLPPMDFGAYYREWKYYRRATFGSKTIKEIHVYLVKPESGKAKVVDEGKITPEDMFKQDYDIKAQDLRALSYSLMQDFKKVGLMPDPALKNLKPGSYLPEGYTSGRFWTFTFPHYADYYNPVFFRQYSSYFFSHIYCGSAKEDAESCNRVWVSADVNGSNLVFHVLLAKYG